MANILIIDDDAAAAQALASLLRREGHDATFAEGAGPAISSLRRQEPDLVLLDLTMPTTDGLDLLDALADEPRFMDLRIAVHSGRSDEESARQAERLGACDFIPKGLEWPKLYERIQSALRAEPVA